MRVVSSRCTSPLDLGVLQLGSTHIDVVCVNDTLDEEQEGHDTESG